MVFCNQRPFPFNCSRDGEWQEGERREKIFQNWQSPALHSAAAVGVQREKLCVGEGRGGRGSLFACYRAGKREMGGLERVGSEGKWGSEGTWVVEQTQEGYGQ